MLLHRLTNLLALLFGIATLVAMLLMGQPGHLDWWRDSFGYVAWAAFPYAVIYVLNNILIEEEPRRDRVLFVTVIVVSGIAVWALLDAFVLDPQPLPVAAFIAAPKWQSIVLLIGGLIAFLLPAVSRRKPAVES